jgi:hypothetical protein
MAQPCRCVTDSVRLDIDYIAARLAASRQSTAAAAAPSLQAQQSVQTDVQVSAEVQQEDSPALAQLQAGGRLQATASQEQRQVRAFFASLHLFLLLLLGRAS